MRKERAIGGLFETITKLAADDFIISTTYDTGNEHISVNVFYDRTFAEFDDLSCYTSLEAVHNLEDELIELHDKYRSSVKLK